ncbi:uncharacterized protein TrAFT101_011317 [Trichoderma asperellum]|uniref:uncharacterized protein n=1 Tax=Trichoderma asperellum TaxID=101201 RepID=UPI00332B08B9|nr:hypothetical protein TrAFT101_011317 [Trichoderma asperellum]
MYPLSDGTLPLYRSTVVLGMTMTGDGADPLPHWATMRYTQTDSESLALILVQTFDSYGEVVKA